MKLTKKQRRLRRKQLGINRHKQDVKKPHVYYTHEATEEIIKRSLKR